MRRESCRSVPFPGSQRDAEAPRAQPGDCEGGIDVRLKRAVRRADSRSSRFPFTDFARFAIPVGQQMVEQDDYLFAAPYLIAQKLGRGFERGALAFGGIPQVEAASAQRVINELGVSGLLQRASANKSQGYRLIPSATMSPEGYLSSSASRVHLGLDFPDARRFRCAVLPRDREHVPDVDRRIQIDQCGDTLLSGSQRT